MLAGKMKLSTFVVAISCLGALVVTGGVLYSANQPEVVVAIAEPVAEPVAAVSAAPPAAKEPAQAPVGRDVDQAALKWQGKTISGGKVKDATKGRAYKINVYQDDGEASVNRLKIDLDRDDKWDEKWTFDGPNVSRKIAPNDDEDYTQSHVWSGEAWVDG